MRTGIDFVSSVDQMRPSDLPKLRSDKAKTRKSEYSCVVSLKKDKPTTKTVCSLLSKANSFGFQMRDFFTCFLLYT